VGSQHGNLRLASFPEAEKFLVDVFIVDRLVDLGTDIGVPIIVRQLTLDAFILHGYSCSILSIIVCRSGNILALKIIRSKRTEEEYTVGLPPLVVALRGLLVLGTIQMAQRNRSLWISMFNGSQCRI